MNGRRALAELHWQDEILQAMFWMQGEGLASAVGAARLAQFLVSEPAVVARQMGRLAAGGYLERVSGRPRRWRLTDLGRLEGGRRFQDEFADMTRPGHGECAPGCACHTGAPCPSHPPRRDDQPKKDAA